MECFLTLQEPLEKPSIVRSCTEDKTKCFPVEQFCDGMADCPLGTDEANSGCSCEELNMATYEDSSLCVFKHWMSDKEPGLSPVGLDNKTHNDSAQNTSYFANHVGKLC